MAYLPIFFDVTGRRCVVIGGGEVAARKVQSLLDAGAAVTVIAPSIVDAIAELVRYGCIVHLPRAYEAGDIADAALVYAATDDAALHRQLYDEARERGVPLNVADVPSLCTFIMPSVLTRGALQIAVSTGGASPAMAERIVARLAGLFGAEYGLALEVLRAARNHLKAHEPNLHVRARKLTALAASGIPEYLRKGDLAAVEEILRREIGVGLDSCSASSSISAENAKTH